MLAAIEDFFNSLTTKKAIYIIIIVGSIVYFNALFNSFVWDDISIFQNPELLKGFNLIEMFGNNRFNVLYYRPLSATYFTLMFHIFDSNYFIYHLFQIVIGITLSLPHWAAYFSFACFITSSLLRPASKPSRHQRRYVPIRSPALPSLKGSSESR